MEFVLNRKYAIIIFLLFSFGFDCLAQEVVTIIDPKTKNEPVAAVDMDLTDQDRHTSQNYVHEWLSHRQMEEECAKLDDPMACRGAGKTEFMGIDSRMIEIVGKAFTAVVGSMDAMGGGAQTQGADGASGEGGSGSQMPCQYIAIGTEAAGTLMQTMAQNDITGRLEGDTNQKNLLYGASSSHEQRAKTAQFQGVGYGATAGCFAFNTVSQPTPGNVLKAAASGFLAAFYLTEAKRQQKHADDVRAIADDLPGKGDCNPITDKLCYCAQPETKNDPDHCMDYLHDKKVADASYRVPCIDGEANADMKCTCVGEDSCFDKKYFTDLDFPGFQDFMDNGFGSEFKTMSAGEFRNGNLNQTAQANAAKANRLNREISRLSEEQAAANGTPLTKSQKEQVKLAQEMGIPKPLATLLAQQPVTPAVRSNIAKLKKGGLGKTSRAGRYAARSKRSKNNVMSFKGGKGLNSKKSRGSTATSRYGKKGKRKPASGSGNTMSFKMAEAASKAAQINKKSDTFIFEIISRRYQASAWRRLDLE